MWLRAVRSVPQGEVNFGSTSTTCKQTLRCLESMLVGIRPDGEIADRIRLLAETAGRLLGRVSGFTATPLPKKAQQTTP